MRRSPIYTLVAAFAAALAAGAFLARRTGLVAFEALSALDGWAVLVGLAALCPPLKWRLRPVLLAVGSVAVAAVPSWLHFRGVPLFAGGGDDTLRLGAVVLSILGFVLYFLAAYAANVRVEDREAAPPALAAFIPLARLLAAMQAAAVGVLLLHLYAQKNIIPQFAKFCAVILGVLLAEMVLRSIARLFQPPRLRKAEVLFGDSVLLPALFGEAGPMRSLAAALEQSFGVRLGQTWFVRLLRALAAPLVLLAMLGLWGSTAATSVPVDGHGVLVVRGVFQSPALEPGLHWHAPWPFARVVIVPTEHVQETALGFDHDLGGPILWTEKHFDGEQNLLTGSGEELLTFNVPIHYRVRDAVAYLSRTADAGAALQALGYRELLRLTTTHTAFGLMTTDRDEVAKILRTGLQQDCDRLGLGVEVTFVGLKDVHPPVAVAPAYQEVVSAEEHREALVDEARTYRVETLAQAATADKRLRLEADAAATGRRDQATGEAARFLAPLPVYRGHTGVFRTRARLEVVEAALAAVEHLYLVPVSSGGGPRAYFLGAPSATVTPATRAATPTILPIR